jgi:hypothetical protein
MIGTEYLIIILLWCGDPNTQLIRGGMRDTAANQVQQCRREKIECVSKLKNFDTDDVVNKCLLGER